MPDERPPMKPAKSLFGYSLLYLFAIFCRLSRRRRWSRACWPGREQDGRELVTLTETPEEGAPQPLDRDRAGAGGAGRHLLCRDAS